jgi:hypothetical protein
VLRPHELKGIAEPKGDLGMRKSNVVCRAVAVVLLLLGLIVLPTAPAVADGSEAEGEAQASQEDQGVVQEALDWLVNLFTGESTEEGEGSPTFDPEGRA